VFKRKPQENAAEYLADAGAASEDRNHSRRSSRQSVGIAATGQPPSREPLYPHEGEIRTYLTDWANYRYTISRDTIAKKYPLNYYFLFQSLASLLMGEDNQNHLVSQVVGGRIEQSDVEVKNVAITSMSQETIQGAVIARGTALLAFVLYCERDHAGRRRVRELIRVRGYSHADQSFETEEIYRASSAVTAA
jgi:hypothetical protein